MSEWEAATEAEAAMRDALRANDQEQYFRILARTDVLLPIAPDTQPSGESGWGTWTTEGRTHVLAFTSPSALQECLAGHPGTHRRVAFRDLAGIWPNVDWWLAVNPGLPIEGYLPSWFVTQISRGDVRLPGRTLGARARMEQASSRTRATAQVPLRTVPNQPAPTPIERQRMKAAEAGQQGPVGAGPLGRQTSAPPAGSFGAPTSGAPGGPFGAPTSGAPGGSFGTPTSGGPSGSFGPPTSGAPGDSYAASSSSYAPSSQHGPQGGNPFDPSGFGSRGSQGVSPLAPTPPADPSTFGGSRGVSPLAPTPPAVIPPSTTPPRRDVPPPDVAPPGAFLPTRTDRPMPYDRQSGRGSSSYPPAATPPPPVGPPGGAAPLPPVPPPSVLPTSGAGSVRGRATPRGLFDDSDRSPLDVPGERELFADIDRGPGSRADRPNRLDQSGRSDLPGRPEQPGRSDPSGRPEQPGRSDLPSRLEQQGRADQPSRLEQQHRAEQLGRGDLAGRMQNGTAGLPARPTGADALLPPRPLDRDRGRGDLGRGDLGRGDRGRGESGLPQRPLGGESGLPQRPVGESGLPQRPVSGPTSPAPGGLPSRPTSPASGLPSRPAGGQGETADEGDPRRYWPRREPASSLGEIFTEHAEPVIPAAWQPPPDLPLPSASAPLPTRQPQSTWPDADQPTFQPGGTLPQRPSPGERRSQRPGLGEPLPQRPGAGESLPQRPGAGESLPQRPLHGESLPQRPGAQDRFAADEPTRVEEPLPQRPAFGVEPLPQRPGFGGEPASTFGVEPLPQRPAFGGEDASVAQRENGLTRDNGLTREDGQRPSGEETQPIRSGWSGAADVRPGRPGLAARGTEPFATGGTEDRRPAETEPPAGAWRSPAAQQDAPAPLPFDRPVFDRPGFSRLDIENPEVDEPPAFGGVAAGARSAGFGGTDLDDHPFFSDGPAAFSDGAPAQGFNAGPPSGRPAEGRAEVPSRSVQPPADEQRIFFEQPIPDEQRTFFEQPPVDEQRTFFQAPADEQRPFFDDEEPRAFNAFAERPPATGPTLGDTPAVDGDDPPIRDPYAALADLRSEPDPDEEPVQPSFASAAEGLTEAGPSLPQYRPETLGSEDKENTGSFFLPKPPRETTEDRPAVPDPSPELRSFFETGAAERPDFRAEAGLDDATVAEQPAYPWQSQAGDAHRDDATVAEQPAYPWQSPSAGAGPESQDRASLNSASLNSASLNNASPNNTSLDDATVAERPAYGWSTESEPGAAEPHEHSWSTEREPGVARESAYPGGDSQYRSQESAEPIYEPEIVEDRPVRLHDEIVDAEVVTAAAPEPARAEGQVKPPPQPEVEFHAANTVEQDLFDAVQANSTDRFLSTLLLAKVLVPFWTGDGPVEPASWRTEHMNGLPHLVVFTSDERMTERLGPDARGSWIKFSRLIRHWPPGDQLAFAINPESPAGAVLPGTEVVQLATWAAELGLGADEPDEQPAAATPGPASKPAPRPAYEPPASARQQVMQKPISPEQLSHYLERNYDRVSGFVHRAGEVEHLGTPEQLYNALGLGYAGSSFKPDAEESYVLRWIAYRGDLYRIPYGGSSHEAMRAMEGWVIERPPFRGNGFAPSETSDVIAEFKVDSARLPHNAELWRLGRDGRQELIARLDADGPSWRKVTQ